MGKSAEERRIQAEFGEMIKAKRKQKKLTQEELSELAGITDVYLRDLERGSYTATWVICLRICTALDIDLKDIQKKYIVPEIAEMQKNMKKRGVDKFSADSHITC